MKSMMTFFAGILSVIAVGVLLIAYGLLSPRVATADGTMLSRPMYAGDRVTLDPGDSQYGANAYGVRQLAYPVSGAATLNSVRTVPAVESYPASQSPASVSRPVRYESRSSVVERAPKRDWIKTAMVIGGSSAAGAGLGGIFGGKKGALIGAALGGGAATIYEVQKR